MDRELWDAIARVERRHWWFRGRRELVASVLRERLPQGARVLDIGCGTGFVLERLLDDFDAHGLEPDPGVRARASERAAPRIRPGSTDDLSALGGQTFDAVLLLDVLEHVDDDVAALRSARPAIAQGGMLLATVPAYPGLWSSHDVRNAHRRRYRRGTLDAALRAAGYRPVILSHINSRLLPLAVVHRGLASLTRYSSERELAIPPRRVNEWFYRLFAGEAAGVARGRPFGLSLLAAAVPSAGA